MTTRLKSWMSTIIIFMLLMRLLPDWVIYFLDCCNWLWTIWTWFFWFWVAFLLSCLLMAMWAEYYEDD